MNLYLNFYSIPPLLSAILFLLLALFVYIKSKKNIVILAFVLSCLTTFWWQFSWFVLFNVMDPVLAAVVVKVGYTGITFLPIVFFYFYASFVNLERAKRFYAVHGIVAGIFLTCLWMSNVYVAGYYDYAWGFYPRAGSLHPLFVVYLASTVFHILYILLSCGASMRWVGQKSEQIKYLILGISFYSISALDFLTNYGIPIYPVGFVFISIFLFIKTLAIVKYRLMDIRLAMTRATIFIFVYVILLGIPLLIGWKTGAWMISTLMMLILASVAPFAYTWARRAVENKLFAQEGFLERQKSLDMMVGSLMHELNNPLSVAAINAEYLEDSLKEDTHEKRKNALRLLRGAVQRMKNLTGTILEYSRAGTGELQKISLKEVVEGFLVIMRPQFKREDIDLVLDCSNEDLQILGDKVQLEEVLVNFGQNSIHALKNVESKRVALKFFLKNERMIRLEFSDNGYGIEPHMLEDIFLPSVTTKPKGEGTGIGLARVRRIIEFHKGSIWAESDGRGYGAKFVVECPCV